MTRLPEELKQQLEKELETHDEFNNDRSLRAVFFEAGIEKYFHSLAPADNSVERAMQVVDLLLRVGPSFTNPKREPLLLFLNALIARAPEKSIALEELVREIQKMFTASYTSASEKDAWAAYQRLEPRYSNANRKLAE